MRRRPPKSTLTDTLCPDTTLVRASNSSGRPIGLLADMDALPILEQGVAPYASTNVGVMHACGHDGHTAVLLGAARYLAETRNFDGREIGRASCRARVCPYV